MPPETSAFDPVHKHDDETQIFLNPVKEEEKSKDKEDGGEQWLAADENPIPKTVSDVVLENDL